MGLGEEESKQDVEKIVCYVKDGRKSTKRTQPIPLISLKYEFPITVLQSVFHSNVISWW